MDHRTEPGPQPASRSLLTLWEDSRRSAARAAASGGGKASPLLARLHLAKPCSPCWFPLRCRWTCPSIYCVSSLRYITLGTGSGSSDLDPRRTCGGVRIRPNRCEAGFLIALLFSFFRLCLPRPFQNRQPENRAPKKNPATDGGEAPPPFLVTSSADRSQRRDAGSSG